MTLAAVPAASPTPKYDFKELIVELGARICSCDHVCGIVTRERTSNIQPNPVKLVATTSRAVQRDVSSKQMLWVKAILGYVYTTTGCATIHSISCFKFCTLRRYLWLSWHCVHLDTLHSIRERRAQLIANLLPGLVKTQAAGWRKREPGKSKEATAYYDVAMKQLKTYLEKCLLTSANRGQEEQTKRKCQHCVCNR